MPLELPGARVLVCGASGGIGSAIVAELLDRGAQITAVARDPERLNRLGAHRSLSLDLTDAGACEWAVRQARDDGELDVVVNAVGVVAFGPITEMSTLDLRELLEINVLVPMLLARAALPHMARGSALVNISGIIAEPGRAMANMAAYTATKAAVTGFDAALAREARRSKVRVLDVRPPHTETGLPARALAGRAPDLPSGLSPARVATVICDAIAGDAHDLRSEAFS